MQGSLLQLKVGNCKSILRHVCARTYTHSHFNLPWIALDACPLSFERKIESGQTLSACLLAERCISTLSDFFSIPFMWFIPFNLLSAVQSQCDLLCILISDKMRYPPSHVAPSLEH